MSDFNLDSMREALEKKFAPFTFTAGDKTIEMGNPLRMKRDKREKLTEDFTRLSQLFDDDYEPAQGEDVEAELLGLCKSVFRTVVTKDATFLLKELGDDYLLMMHIINMWAEEVNLGEASSSQD